MLCLTCTRCMCLSSALSSRLASSLSDLYAADVENRKAPYSSLSPSSSSSVSLSPSLSSIVHHGNGPSSAQREVNNNSGPYGGPAASPTGKGFVRPGPQDLSPYRVSGPHSAMKGPSGRYLSRSIPVSPLTQQQLSPAPLYWLVLSALTSLTQKINEFVI